MLHLLTGNPSSAITDFDYSVYASLRSVKSATSKALLWTVGFSALGVLAHFNLLKGASAVGLELVPSVFIHVALVGASVAGAWFCFNWTKQTFLQAWFGWKLRAGTPGFKARCLLLFPDAYWHFAYLRGNVGYPPYHLARTSIWPQLIYLLLVTVALAVGAIGSIGLWLILAHDVLANSQINHTISTLTVVFCAASTLLGWSSPFWYDRARLYTHTGLVSLLSNLEGERNAAAHRRLIRVADRMGLIDWPQDQ